MIEKVAALFVDELPPAGGDMLSAGGAISVLPPAGGAIELSGAGSVVVVVVEDSGAMLLLGSVVVVVVVELPPLSDVPVSFGLQAKSTNASGIAAITVIFFNTLSPSRE